MLTDEELSKRMREENSKEEEIKKQLSSLQPKNEKISKDELIEVLHNICENREHMDAIEKRCYFK